MLVMVVREGFSASASHSMKRRSGCGNGSGSRSSERTTLKIAVFAPMPNASVITATAAKPGLARSMRTLWRMSRHRLPGNPRMPLAGVATMFAGSRAGACSSCARAAASASSSGFPAARATRHVSSTCCASSSTAWSDGAGLPLKWSRTNACQSRMAQPRDADEGADEGVPAGAAFREGAPACRRDAVVAPAALSGALDPAALDQLPPFHPVEQGIERRGVEGQDTVRALLDQLRDFVPVPGPLLQQREDEHFSAALLERGVRWACSSHMYVSYISWDGPTR